MTKAVKRNLFQMIDRSFSRVTGREHQYCIKLAFRPKGHQGPVHTWTVLPSMTYRPNGRDFYRALKVHYGPGFIKGIREQGINPNNGKITIDSITYLGRH
ncbi:MAG: hypothetical protein ACRC8B_22925 [Aeromonas sobria]|uniref:hypothetical protein n=1 Tax=Aeromonas sobria TaxID=646 RepID=UPI003F33EC53